LNSRWVLSDWRWAVPRTNVDRIHAILRERGEPMHFSDVAAAYRERFSQINDRNVHAALGRSDLFVLRGAGRYGLREWGDGKVRWVIDIVEEFLEARGRPATEEE